MTSLRALQASVMLLLAGCASLDPVDHPRAWGPGPQTQLSNGCPELSGTYGVRASDTYPAGAPPSPALHELLGPGTLRDAQQQDAPWPALRGATTATFTSSGDWLFVRFHDDAGGEATLRFKRKDWWGGTVDGSHAMFQCRQLELGPALGFDAARRPIASVPYLFAEEDVDFLFLSKGRDGALVANYRTDRVFFTGALLGSHARWTRSTWWRYPPSAPKP